MKTNEDTVIAFMDILDIGEDVIDERLQSIITRSSFEKRHLLSALSLLNYKHLINTREDGECENEEEYRFVCKLMSNLNDENVEIISKITKTVLCLHVSTLVSKSEHLLHQLLSEGFIESNSVTEEVWKAALFRLKVCNSVLEAVGLSKERLSLYCLEIPLDKVFDMKNDRVSLRNYFLTTLVPNLFEHVSGYNILDSIWQYIKCSNSNGESLLNILSSLSAYYIPVSEKGTALKYVTAILNQNKFWNIIMFGLNSNNATLRKTSVYLTKRTIDCLTEMRKDLIIIAENGETIFTWNKGKEAELKQTWCNYFILLESLEEKQSNIVLPSLRLFSDITELGSKWLNPAFNLGLKHDNTLIKFKCLGNRLEHTINTVAEATIVLEAINDINLYDKQSDIQKICEKFQTICMQRKTLEYVLKAMTTINWSPVPFYYTVMFLPNIDNIKYEVFTENICEILKIQCTNIAIRYAIQMKILSFYTYNSKLIDSEILFKLWTSIQFSKTNTEFNQSIITILEKWITNLNIQENTDSLLEFISSYYTAKVLIKSFLNTTEKSVEYMGEIMNKIIKIRDINSRQYCKKTDHFDEFVYLLKLYKETNTYEDDYERNLNEIIGKEIKTLAQYILGLILDDEVIGLDKMSLFMPSIDAVFDSDINNTDIIETIDNITSISRTVLLDGNSDINRKVFALNVLKYTNKIEDKNRLNLETLIKLSTFTSKERNGNTQGRMQNIYYETLTEMVYKELLNNSSNLKQNSDKINAFIEKILETGGYGCLKWTIKIINIILSKGTVEVKLNKFVDRLWMEIEELKSNNQYAICIEEFVKLLLSEPVLKAPMYNNMVLSYSKKIQEQAVSSSSPTALYYLAKLISELDLTSDLGQVIYVLHEILLYAPVPRKDQRITDRAVQEIIKEPEMKFINYNNNATIHQFAIKTLLNITPREILDELVKLVIKKLEETFKNKKRYHANSQPHRLLMIGVQHLIQIGLVNPSSVVTNIGWFVQMLAKMPHQPSIRICLEWCLALAFYFKAEPISKEIINNYNLNSIPHTSQFMIPYLVARDRILSKEINEDELNFVMNLFLTNTMGQLFSTRLHAQYLSAKLYYLAESKGCDVSRYKYTIRLIESNFEANPNEKSLIKLKKDYFVNEFGITACLTPKFIYNFLPKYFSEDSDVVEEIRAPSTEDCKILFKTNVEFTRFYARWQHWKLTDKAVLNHKFEKSNEAMVEIDEQGQSGAIQKKYIPWRSMSEHCDGTAMKKGRTGDLIVVASLVDKLPNLGGLARTSEVFGVKTYVIDSLRHLQDKQFQGLSVSAERWVDIEEVRPGKPLKDYIMMKRSEGYSVVAAEQTSDSVLLPQFKFDKKTLLVLGHEKEGVPCDLLPLMDHCVEIPQQGFVRSLNVHVTAAIFVWEYSRQIML